MQRCQLAVPQQLWAHDVLSVCLWVNPRGRPGRRDRCEICDECKGQEERRGPEGFTKTSTIRLYRRCLADASDSVMWSFRRLQGNMLTCLRSSSADNTTRSVEWSCRHRGQIVRQQPSGTNMWNNPSVLLINRFQTQLDFVLVLCHCQFSSADHFASL